MRHTDCWAPSNLRRKETDARTAARPAVTAGLARSRPELARTRNACRCCEPWFGPSSAYSSGGEVHVDGKVLHATDRRTGPVGSSSGRLRPRHRPLVVPPHEDHSQLPERDVAG